MTQEPIVIFKAISNFVKQLTSQFGDDEAPLRLYNKLLNMTEIGDEKAIDEQINLFGKYWRENEEAIYATSVEDLNSDTIKYSDRMYIDLKNLMRSSEQDTLNVIWKHVLTISALVNPEGKARDTLKNMKTKESKFIENIIGSVTDNLGKMDLPNSQGDQLKNVLQSDFMSNIVQSIQGGDLDMSKIFATLGSVVQSISNPAAVTSAQSAVNPGVPSPAGPNVAPNLLLGGPRPALNVD